MYSTGEDKIYDIIRFAMRTSTAATASKEVTTIIFTH